VLADSVLFCNGGVGFKNSLIVIYPSVGVRVYFFRQFCVLLVAIRVPEKK